MEEDLPDHQEDQEEEDQVMAEAEAQAEERHFFRKLSWDWSDTILGPHDWEDEEEDVAEGDVLWQVSPLPIQQDSLQMTAAGSCC